MTDTTLYDILGVARTATAEEIRVAFHERARILEKDTAHPQAPEHLQRLRQAYQVLGDPQRRKQYDASLPCPDMGPERQIDITLTWKRVGELYFQRSERFTPAIDAVRVAVPLIMEDENLLVLGMDHSHATLMGYLTATITYNEVRQLLCEVTECQLDYRVIAGTSVKDWQSIKDAEEAIRKKRLAPSVPTPAAASQTPSTTEQISSALPPQQEPVPAHIEKSGDRWEELMENMFRQWSALDHRGFPQSRARFVLEQVAVVLRLEDASNTAGVPEESTQRHVARAIDRIASLSGIESGAVALEFLRQRVGMSRTTTGS
jgi:hypothetical protein